MIGAKLPIFLSTHACVETSRDGKVEHIDFKDGIFQERKIWEDKERLPGTTVTWEPDPQFFEHAEVELNKVKELFKTTVCFCPGLKIKLVTSSGQEEFYSEKGLRDYVTWKVGDEEILKDRFELHEKKDKNQIDFILTWTSSYSSTIVPYVNTGLTEKGPHITTVKALITRELNKFFREQGWLKEKEDNLSGDDVQEGMYVVFNLTTTGVAYDSQTKNNISRIDMSPFLTELTIGLNSWFATHKSDLKSIADKALAARKAREAAKKARDAVRNSGQKSKSKFLNLPTKLVDAWSKKRADCELFISEGDSAANGIIAVRNGETQAVFPIRGKILSCRKQRAEKVYANQEISNIVKALGLEMDKKTGKLIYDESKLRYGRIVLTVDADPDGANIANLLICCLWWLCPELITKGHIYRAIPPLFRITTKKNEYIFLKGQQELDEYKKAHTGQSFLINRNKG